MFFATSRLEDMEQVPGSQPTDEFVRYPPFPLERTRQQSSISSAPRRGTLLHHVAKW